MTRVKCKICQNEIESVKEGYAICSNCKKPISLPSINGKDLKAYIQATERYFSNKFDEAHNQFEKIKSKDADVYWSLLLCDYGINYLKTASDDWQPWIWKYNHIKIFDNSNYIAAYENATEEQKDLYE